MDPVADSQVHSPHHNTSDLCLEASTGTWWNQTVDHQDTTVWSRSHCHTIGNPTLMDRTRRCRSSADGHKDGLWLCLWLKCVRKNVKFDVEPLFCNYAIFNEYIYYNIISSGEGVMWLCEYVIQVVSTCHIPYVYSYPRTLNVFEHLSITKTTKEVVPIRRRSLFTWLPTLSYYSYQNILSLRFM